MEVSSHSLPWNERVILVTPIRRGLPAFLVSPLLSPSCWDVCWDLYGRSWLVIPPSLCCAAVIDFLFWWTVSQKIHNDYSSGEEGTWITVILFCGTIVTFPSCFLKCCFWVMHSYFSSCKCMNYIASAITGLIMGVRLWINKWRALTVSHCILHFYICIIIYVIW